MKTVLAAVFIYHRHNVRFLYSEQGIPARLSVPFLEAAVCENFDV